MDDLPPDNTQVSGKDELTDLVAASDFAVLVLDRRLRIQHFTPEAKRLWRWTGSGTGSPVRLRESDLVDPHFLEDCHDVLETMTTREREISRTGGRRLVRRIAPCMDTNSQPSGVVVSIQDVTSAAEAEQDLHHLTTQLGRAVGLQQEVAVIANEAESVRSALAQTLSLVCEHQGWPVGHVYIKSDDQEAYVSSRIWRLPPEMDVTEFRAQTAGARYAGGAGLIGQSTSTGLPHWSRDISSTEDEWRTRGLKALGIQSVYTFPILVGTEVVGVMEFFSRGEEQPEPALMDGMKQLGTHLGRAFERRRFSRDLEARTTEEQRRIAVELHDTLGQQLSGVSMLMTSIQRKINRKSLPSQALLDRTLQAVEDARQDIRRLSRGLIPIDIPPNGLADALEALADSLTSLYGIQVRSMCEEGVQLESDFAATTLYQIAREMIQNAIRHAQTNRIDVRVAHQTESGQLCLAVQDYGTGLKDEPSGVGFQIMRYRASLIDGTIEVESSDSGTRVCCCIPGSTG